MSGPTELVTRDPQGAADLQALWRVRRFRVDSEANSSCESASLEDLDWSTWWMDNSYGMIYIHVRDKRERDAWHRVYCRKSETPRLACRDGALYWLVSDSGEK